MFWGATLITHGSADSQDSYAYERIESSIREVSGRWCWRWCK